ncbi:hypothetical protein EVAR_577_1 [Eumeta japonica]|uniref:Retrovirus-related Pol polyprotein from transposon opus n=1 Tax=Eumeta variegata TaxID=151549 RepID=A0A4C1SD66_EUMVA|nr:hypothetical protein EVAR_577_1 [Eumeta japonica]
MTEKIKISALLNDYKHIFAKDKYDIGQVKNYEAFIDLQVEKYCSKRPYRCSLDDKKEIEKQIEQLLKNELIEESYSPFAAPVTLAFKRDEGKKSRLCIDFRDLNKIIIPQPQPFPLIEDLLEHLKNLSKLLDAIAEEGFRLKLTKCKFAAQSVRFLGHIVEGNTITPLKDNLRSIAEFPAPQNKKQIRQFLDHKPLENLNIKNRTDDELGDMTHYLSQYNFVIKYNPGKCNTEADCLSRNPVYESHENEEDKLKTVNIVRIEEILEDQNRNPTLKNKHSFIKENGPAEKPFQIMSIDTVGGFGGNRSSKRARGAATSAAPPATLRRTRTPPPVPTSTPATSNNICLVESELQKTVCTTTDNSKKRCHDSKEGTFTSSKSICTADVYEAVVGEERPRMNEIANIALCKKSITDLLGTGKIRMRSFSPFNIGLRAMELKKSKIHLLAQGDLAHVLARCLYNCQAAARPQEMVFLGTECANAAWASDE